MACGGKEGAILHSIVRQHIVRDVTLHSTEEMSEVSHFIAVRGVTVHSGSDIFLGVSHFIEVRKDIIRGITVHSGQTTFF